MSNFDETFDFVVVGSGGGSMAAALVARQAGKSVLILEKTALIGGTTARSGGVMWIPNNRFMKRDGVPDSAEMAMEYLDDAVGDHNDTPGATRARRARYVEKGTEMVDFLVDQGIKLNRVSYWPDYYDELPGGSEQGRTVVAELFNVKELGEWGKKLRPNFLSMQASLDDMLKLRYVTKSGEARKAAAKLVGRTIWANSDRQALRYRRCGVAGADAAGGAQGRGGHPQQFARHQPDRGERPGGRRRHREGRQALAGRREERRADQRRRFLAQPGDARSIPARHPQRLVDDRRG